MEVEANAVEQIYKVGTIKFFSGSTEIDDGAISKLYDVWTAIENPHELFKMLQETYLID